MWGVILFTNITINQGIPDEAFTGIPAPGTIFRDRGNGLYMEEPDKESGYTTASDAL